MDVVAQFNSFKSQTQEKLQANITKSQELWQTNINRTQEIFSTHVTKLTNSLAEGVDKILNSIPDTNERDKALRKLIAPQAPCPVPGATWSLINAVDFDFEGFSGQHLTDFNILKQLPHVALNAFHQPSLLVIRDLSLAAKLSYEDPAIISYFCQKWGMDHDDTLNFNFKDLRAFIMHDRYNIVLTFRGTEIINPKDWSTDVKLNLVPMISQASDGADPVDEAAAKIGAGAKVHFGFYNALGLTATYQGVSPYSIIYGVLQRLRLENPQKKLWITGHSLGGALSSVFVGQLLLDDEFELIEQIAGVYTYGQPRSGNQEYCNLFDDLVKQEKNFRTVNKTDLICKLPMEVTSYAHHGLKISISRSHLTFPCKGELVERNPQILRSALPPNSTLKKVVFSTMPPFLEDHFPPEYCRDLNLFV